MAVWVAWLVDRLRVAELGTGARLPGAPTHTSLSQKQEAQQKKEEAFEAVTAVAKALQTSPLDPRKWRRNDSPGGPSDAFELALIRELLQPSSSASDALGEDWHQWLSANHAAGSTQVCSALLSFC